MFPYFRLSIRVRSAVGLEQWFKFLSERDIACCIVKRGYRQYYLFREGMEHTLQGVVEGDEDLGGDIVKAYDPRGVFVES